MIGELLRRQPGRDDGFDELQGDPAVRADGDLLVQIFIVEELDFQLVPRLDPVLFSGRGAFCTPAVEGDGCPLTAWEQAATRGKRKTVMDIFNHFIPVAPDKDLPKLLI
jgi:hypothetical protein